MANDAAWQAGVDVASGKKSTAKKQAGDDSAPTDAWSAGAKIAQGMMQKGKAKSTLSKAKQATTGLDTTQQAVNDLLPSYKHGGRVRKTGVALLHRGEHVIPAGKHRSRKPSTLRKTFSQA